MDSRLKDYLSNLKNDENNGLAFFLIIAVVVVAIVGWLLYFIPQLQTASVTTETLKLSFNAENEARKTLAQIFGGLVALVLVFLGWSSWETIRFRFASGASTPLSASLGTPKKITGR